MAGATHAQTYPARPITFVVPFGPGTGNDIIARIIAQKVTENWGNNVVVENRPGASGAIAMEITAKAQPDAHNAVIASTTLIVNQLVSKVRYDVLRDYAPVSVVGSMPYVLAVNQNSPAKSINDLIAMAKARPSKMNYAGILGGVPHFMGEMLKSAGGIDIVMVPNKLSAESEVEVLAGRIEIWISTLSTAIKQAKAGKVRVLGVGGGKR